jgi:hypothetical protein
MRTSLSIIAAMAVIFAPGLSTGGEILNIGDTAPPLVVSA